MPRKVKRDEVDWLAASCRGLNTDFFYLEEEFLLKKQIKERQIRNICFQCPIQRECLEVGFAEERYGMWGGITSLERTLIYKKEFDSQRLLPLKKYLKQMGESFDEVIRASDVERRLL